MTNSYGCVSSNSVERVERETGEPVTNRRELLTQFVPEKWQSRLRGGIFFFSAWLRGARGGAPPPKPPPDPPQGA